MGAQHASDFADLLFKIELFPRFFAKFWSLIQVTFVFAEEESPERSELKILLTSAVST